MIVIRQKSSRTVRGHSYDAQGVPAVPLTAHWKVVRGASATVVQDWTALEVETTTTGGQLSDVSIVLPIVSGLTQIPGDYTAIVTLDKDTDTELTEEVPFRVTQVRGR
jgi:hypothetical protein